MSNCLNCGAKIKEGLNHCDELCKQAWNNKQYDNFVKTYKKELRYYDK